MESLEEQAVPAKGGTGDVAVDAMTAQPRAPWWTALAAERARLIKTGVGLLLLGFAGHKAYEAAFVTKSSAAFVVATLSTVAAPIDGYLAHEVGDAGARLASGESVGAVKNPRVDRSRLAHLEAELTSLRGDLAALEVQEAGYSALGAKFETRGASFLAKRRQQLELEISQADARVDSERAKDHAAQAALLRVEALAKEGVATAQELDDARRNRAVTEKSLLVALKDRERQSALLDSTREGFMLGDVSASDRSYSSQRADEVTLRLAELTATLGEKRAALAALEQQVRAERAQVELLAEARLPAPGERRVWEVLATDGEYVVRGRPLFTWIDCTKIHVVAYLTETEFKRVTTGTETEIRVPGVERRFSGRVTMLLGLHDHQELPKQAAALERKAPGHAVLVASESLARELREPCSVGQAAEVRFF